MAALNGFDKISGIYDSMAKIVFGKSIVQAQLHFLHKIPAQAKVLILGGGTGWILGKLKALQPSAVVDYVEASSGMLAIAKAQNENLKGIKFIHGTEENISASRCYDVVITNFYLDLFPEDKLMSVVSRIALSLKDDAQWIATDFVNEGKWWQVFLLRLMYLFFRLTCNIESAQLPDWKGALSRAAFLPLEATPFYGGFIRTGFFQHKNV